MYNYEKQKTYPNQKMITIHKDPVKENFLQVNICEWQEAFATLPRISFGLYLYLCGNKDQFHLALSSVDVQKSLGVSDSSYRRAVEDLLAAGYLIMRNGNEHTLDFFTKPQPTDYVKKERKKKKPATDGGAAGAEPVSMEDTPSEPPADDDEENLSSYLLSQYSSSKYEWS
ncbi:MAG: hypothetical protein IJD39_04995 [Clostridia bacterium]|nr:hypothetical protein [Clostridia bacterium]